MQLCTWIIPSSVAANPGSLILIQEWSKFISKILKNFFSLCKIVLLES